MKPLDKVYTVFGCLVNLYYILSQFYYTIALGEFGIVYKGYIKKSDSHSIEEYLAIKTLKGMLDHTFLP